MSTAPQFLVSVRNANECESAYFGGADIIDVKEPNNGSLGMADLDVLREIRGRLKSLDPEARLSIALGELSDWFDSDGLLPSAKTRAEQISALGPQYVKLGLTGRAEWRKDWAAVRALPFGPTTWVAVAYADSERASSPRPEEVLAEGLQIGCGVLLIDTFRKDGTSLLDWLDHDRLQALSAKTHDAGMKLALAGKITAQSLPVIGRFTPDIVAVRGAVCDQGVRERGVDQCLVADFRRQLHGGSL